jgi:hypothetical protein
MYEEDEEEEEEEEVEEEEEEGDEDLSDMPAVTRVITTIPAKVKDGKTRNLKVVGKREKWGAEKEANVRGLFTV